LKDLVDTAGVRTTAGSGVFKDRVPVDDAEVVRRLKAAGAVLVGKTNMHEFGFGGTSLVTYIRDVRNPRDQRRIAGGSSGGSAAAVAAGLCFRRARIGHGRVDPPAGRVLRNRGVETDFWPREHDRRGPVVMVARSRRAGDPNGQRRRPDAPFVSKPRSRVVTCTPVVLP
jgi:hypothetical protein